jgi:hypothetical protein
MKLSPETIEILKNFSNINNSIVISPGNVIRTINEERNVFAKATVQETFPVDVPIYELRQFLNIFTLHKDADVDFSNEHYILVEQGKTRMKFYYADLYSLSRNINLPSEDYELKNSILSFNLDSHVIEKVRKAANMYGLTDLSLIGSEGKVELVVHNKEDVSSKSYNIEIGETDNDFSLNFIEKNIMTLPGSYQVDIARFSTNAFASKFTNLNQSLEYVIALEPDSSFN